MDIWRIELDYQSGVTTVDIDLGDGVGREFEFPLGAHPEFSEPARALGQAGRRAVEGRIRVWLEEMEAADLETDGQPTGGQPARASAG